MSTKRGLSTAISHQLGERIISGRIPAGESFRLQDLEEEFGVSVTVAREVMLSLQSKGLVEARPRRGISVLSRSHWDLLDADVLAWHNSNLGPIIADLEEARRLIEPWAARTAAQTGDRDGVLALREAMTALREASLEGDRREVTAADLEFHRRLLESSGNSVISRIARVIEPALRRRDELTMPEDHITDLAFLPLHEAIVAAIETKEPERAAEAALRLIESSGADSSEALEPR